MLWISLINIYRYLQIRLARLRPAALRLTIKHLTFVLELSHHRVAFRRLISPVACPRQSPELVEYALLAESPMTLGLLPCGKLGASPLAHGLSVKRVLPFSTQRYCAMAIGDSNRQSTTTAQRFMREICFWDECNAIPNCPAQLARSPEFPAYIGPPSINAMAGPCSKGLISSVLPSNHWSASTCSMATTLRLSC